MHILHSLHGPDPLWNALSARQRVRVAHKNDDRFLPVETCHMRTLSWAKWLTVLWQCLNTPMLDSCQTTRVSHSKDEIMLRKKKKKPCTTCPTSPWKKQEKQKFHFWSFSRVYKGRGTNSYFHDSHTLAAQLYGRGIALTGIYLNATGSPLTWLSQTHCTIHLPPLPSFALPLKTHPSFLPLAECATHSCRCLAPKLQPDETFPLEPTAGREAEEGRKKRGERAVWLSNRSNRTETQLRTESSGMPR